MAFVKPIVFQENPISTFTIGFDVYINFSNAISVNPKNLHNPYLPNVIFLYLLKP